jgi:hypothetical protein
MSETIQTARGTIQDYDRTHDPAMLRKAGEQLDLVDLFAARSAEQRATARLRTLETWLMVLSRVDTAKGPEPDPNDPPASKVAPPLVPGHFYLPGADPAQITDPRAREEYEKSIVRNQEKTERWRRYWDWEAIDIEVTQGARRFIKRFYTAAPPDQKELHETMAREDLSERRVEQLIAP